MDPHNFQLQKSFKYSHQNSVNFKLTEQEKQEAISLIEKIHLGEEKLEVILNNEEKVFKLIISILIKSYRKRRSDEDLDILSKIVSKNYFFQQILEREDGQELLQSSCQKLSYLFTPAGHAIFKEGDPAENFYLIIRGQIRVSKIIGDAHEEHTIAYLPSGKGFGEIALINDCSRTASVWTVEDTHLAVLSREDFKSFARNLVEINTYTFIKFRKTKKFASLNCVKNWPFKIQKQVFDKLTFETVGMDYQVYHEGDNSSKVYFIHSGEFKMTKTTQFNDDDTPNIKQIIFPQIQGKNLDFSLSINSKTLRGLKAENQYNFKNTTVKVMQIGQMFGDLELFHEDFRQTSVRTNHEVNTFYWIPKCLFLPIISQDQNLTGILKDIIEVKRQLVLQTIENLHKQIHALKPYQRFMKQMKQEQKPAEQFSEKNNKLHQLYQFSHKNINLRIQDTTSRQILNKEKTIIPPRTLSSVAKLSENQNLKSKPNLQISTRQYLSVKNEHKTPNKTNQRQRNISLYENPFKLDYRHERSQTQQSNDFYAYSLKIFAPKVPKKKGNPKYPQTNNSCFKMKPLRFENSFLVNSHCYNIVSQDDRKHLYQSKFMFSTNTIL